MKKITIIMSFCVSLATNYAANVENSKDPDFAGLMFEQDKQENWKEIQVEVYGPDIIVTDGFNAMIFNVNITPQDKGWNLVDICNDAVKDFLGQLGSKRQVLIEDVL